MFNKCFLIAEIGQAHDGSVGFAESFCNEIKKAGFDAVKFQMHLPQYESTFEEEFRYKFSFTDKKRFDYWERTSFDIETWVHLVNISKDLGLKVGISPFSKKAVDICRNLKVDFIKIGSGEVFNNELLDYLNKEDNVIMSSGMSTLDETIKTFKTLKKKVKNISIMHCFSSYPCDLDELNLCTIKELKKHTKVDIGYSDHSGDLNVSMAAIAYGSDLIEVHCAFSKNMFGPDSKSSLTFEEMKKLTQFRDILEMSNGNLENVKNRDKNQKILRMKTLFGRSIALKKNFPKGYKIKRDDICMKKPYGGIPYNDIGQVIGSILQKNYDSNYLLKNEDLYE